MLLSQGSHRDPALTLHRSDCDMLVVWVFIMSSLKVVSLFHCGETYHSPTQTQAPCFKCVWLSVLVGLQVFLCIWLSGLCLFSVTATMMDALMLVERREVSQDSPSERAEGAGQWEVSRAGRMMACVVGWRTDDTVRFNIKQVELWQQPHRPREIISGWIKWDLKLVLVTFVITVWFLSYCWTRLCSSLCVVECVRLTVSSCAQAPWTVWFYFELCTVYVGEYL